MRRDNDYVSMVGSSSWHPLIRLGERYFGRNSNRNLPNACHGITVVPICSLLLGWPFECLADYRK